MNGPPPDSEASQPLPEIGGWGDFIGREQQLSEVNQRLAKHRLVTLVGPGGMGKTRLALKIIERKRTDSVPGTETVFVTLELVTENSEGAVLDALISGLKLIPGDAENLRAALVQRLTAPPVLLVLDNCETARRSVAKLVGPLLDECPGLRILATSQHQLGLGACEAVYELPPLLVPDDRPGARDTLEDLESYKLFVARAKMAAAAWTPEEGSAPSLRRLLRLTEGIPLAIEIIAAWAPIMSLAQISEELERTPFASVTERDEYNPASPGRHGSMWRCLEWSFRHLAQTSPKNAEGFKKLGVFAGRFTEEAVGKVCEVDPPLQLLNHLAKVSLVHPCLGTNPRRYSMLRFTRDFAREQTRTGGMEQDLIKRHVDFFFKLASPLNEEGEWESAPLASPENDWPDLLAAADSAFRIGNFQAVWRISGALSRFLRQHGRWSECERLNRVAVEAASQARVRGALVRSLINFGGILEAQGRWPEAEQQYRLSLASADEPEQPNPMHQAMALQRLGVVLARMGDTAEAEIVAGRLKEVTKLLDQPKAKAHSLEAEAKQLKSRGDLEGAELKYREAFEIKESIGDHDGVSRARTNLGEILTLRGIWGPAESELHTSLRYWTAQERAHEQGIILNLLADLSRRQGRYPEAKDYCAQSLKCHEDHPGGRVVTLGLLAKIHRIECDYADAIVVSEDSRVLCRSLGDMAGESIALENIGTAYMELGQWEKALAAVGESLRIRQSESTRDIPGLGITYDLIAQLHARRGHWPQAQEAYKKSLRLSQTAGQTVNAAFTLMNVAMLHAAQGDKDTALEELDKVIASLESEQSGKTVLEEAQKIRSRLDRKMKAGTPWIHWQDAAFKNQSISIRKRFEVKRDAKLWKELAVDYEEIAENCRESGRQMEAALALNELGGAYRELGDFGRSEYAIRQAMGVFEKITLQIGQAASWHKLGDLFAKQNKFREAENAFKESVRLKVECDDDEGESISLGALAKLLIKTGRFTDAEHASIRELEIVSHGGSVWQKWHPMIRILWLKVKQGSLSDATAVTARLAEAVQGNRRLETAASELRAMTEAGDRDGVNARLARDGIIGPAEAATDADAATGAAGPIPEEQPSGIPERQPASQPPPKLEFLKNHPPRVRVNGVVLQLPGNRYYAILLLLAESYTADKPAPQLQTELLEPFLKVLNELPDRFNLPPAGHDENFRDRCVSAHKVASQGVTGKPDTPIASILSDLRKKLLKLRTSNDKSASVAARSLLGYFPDKRRAFQLRGVNAGDVLLEERPV